jgi:hypothetical protein
MNPLFGPVLLVVLLGVYYLVRDAWRDRRFRLECSERAEVEAAFARDEERARRGIDPATFRALVDEIGDDVNVQVFPERQAA